MQTGECALDRAGVTAGEGPGVRPVWNLTSFSADASFDEGSDVDSVAPSAADPSAGTFASASFFCVPVSVESFRNHTLTMLMKLPFFASSSWSWTSRSSFFFFDSCLLNFVSRCAYMSFGTVSASALDGGDSS